MRYITRHLGSIKYGKDTAEENKCIFLDIHDYDEDLTDLEILRLMQGETPGLLHAATTNRNKVIVRPDWPRFQKAEWPQLDKHDAMGVYG